MNPLLPKPRLQRLDRMRNGVSIPKDKYASLSEPGFRWPWHFKWWKPKSRREDLVRAGALILAEIERLDRAAPEPTHD